MSEAHDSRDELADAVAYESGHAMGLSVIAELQRAAPREGNQKTWLLGFLQAAIEAAGQPASQTTRIAHPPSGSADASGGPEFSDNTRYQAHICDLKVHGHEQTGWRSIAFAVDDPNLRYSPGSSLALWPSNDPEEVRRILRVLGASAQQSVPCGNTSEPAWRMLLERVDISSLGNDALRLLAEYCRSSSEAGSLAALTDTPCKKPRSLLALLRRFPSARPPIERLLASLDPLQPSYVPIASSCLERARPLLTTVHTNAETLTWGGVSPAIDSKLRVGEWLSISVDNTRFPSSLCADPIEPVIIIADGPYLALARAFAAERRERQAKGRTWVIAVGNESSQFPFAQTLAAWHRAGNLTRFDIALGLDSQDTLRALTELEENLWRWLVDLSRCYLITARQNLQTDVTAWFTALLARRYRLDPASASQRLSELSRHDKWVILPTKAESR